MKTTLNLLLLVCLVGCSQSPQRVSFDETAQAASKVLSEALVSMPMDIKKVHNMLYISDFSRDSLLHCYDLSKQSFVRKMLPQGQGANEFLSPIEYFFSDSTLFIHNRWHFTAQEYVFHETDFSIEPAKEKFHLPQSVDRIIPVNKGRYMVSGVFEDCRFQLLDAAGKCIAKYGDFPSYQDGEEKIPYTAKAMFHQLQLGYNGALDRLAAVSSNVLEIWENASDELALRKRLLLAPYHYKFEESPDGVYAANDNPDAELGARGIAVTDRYVYVLYNPNTYRAHDERTENRNSEIWVFDWEGEPVRKILTDTRIECLYVDKDDAQFYCVMSAPDFCVGTLELLNE